MNLRELRAAHPDLFYPQDWFEGQAFMEREPGPIPSPHFIVRPEHVAVPTTGAVELAHVYLRSQQHPAWRRFLWTTDVDDTGQRIYVGGVNRGRVPGFQIHRHLEITRLWGVPVW